jgi:hypothetical protein
MGKKLTNQMVHYSLIKMTSQMVHIHYEKLCPLKPHYPPTKTLKTTNIQVLCSCPLSITTIVQLSPKNTMY